MKAVPFGFALALSLVACRRSAPPPSEPEPSGSVGPTPSAPAYRAESVAHGGTIRGRVVFEGAPPNIPAVAVPENATPNICGANQVPPAIVVSPTGGVRDTVLSIAGLDHGKALPTSAPRVDQRGCQYVPHVSAGVLGQSVEFTSSDPTILHTIRGYRGDQGTESWFARATPAGVTVRVPLDRAGLGTVYCDSGHTWMLGYVWAFAHPYFAVSDGEGAFEMRDVPPGNYTLHAWHEGFVPQPPGPGERVRFAGAMERDLAVTVPADGVVNVRFVVSASGMRVESLSPRPLSADLDGSRWTRRESHCARTRVGSERRALRGVGPRTPRPEDELLPAAGRSGGAPSHTKPSMTSSAAS